MHTACMYNVHVHVVIITQMYTQLKYIVRKKCTYCIAGKFGGDLNLYAYTCTTIPYRTAKFTSANISISAALDQTTTFKDRQYFWLYSI